MSSRSAVSGCVTAGAPLDVAEVHRVRTALLQALDAAGARQGVVLDLSDCEFVDAVGHRMLVDATRTAGRRGLTLELVGVSARVVRLIRRLDGVLSEDVGAHITPPRTEPRAVAPSGRPGPDGARAAEPALWTGSDLAEP